MKSDELLAWIDIETTGLDPRDDSLLEIACIITDRNLNAIDRFHSVAWYPFINVDDTIHPVVKEMHTKSGLWEEANVAMHSESVCYALLGEFLQSVLNVMPDHKKFVMAGSGVARFDFTWFQLNDPDLINRYFAYYTLDIGVVRRSLELAGCFIRNDDDSPRNNLNHRAMDDIIDHMNEWKFYHSILSNIGHVEDWVPNAT